MFEPKPVSERISLLREQYRSCKRYLCTERFKLVTEYYKEHPEEFGVTRRGRYLKYVCENIPITIHPGEIIVGAQSPVKGASALYPEDSIDWVLEEVGSGFVSTREVDPYFVTDEDKQAIMELGPFWLKRCQSAVTDALIPEGYKKIAQPYQLQGWTPYPVGHYVVGHKTMLARGFTGIKSECQRRMQAVEDRGTMADDVEKYNNWRAMAATMEAGIIWANRYADLAEQQGNEEREASRAIELKLMAANLRQIANGTPQTFFQAVQLMYLYQSLVYLDAQLHGTSYGRVDMFLYPYLKHDLEQDVITEEYAQEIIDAWVLKAAETNKFMEDIMTRANPGYTSGQLVTLSGVDSYGLDSTNDVTYMVLQSTLRLKLHDPAVCVRVHQATPDKLWEAIIDCNAVNGGVPSLQNDEVIIPALLNRNMGFSLSDARDYALVGCMEPGGNGNDWPAPGCSVGKEGMTNFADILLRAMFQGHNPMLASSLDDLGPQISVRTKSFEKMTSMDELLQAVKEQLEFQTRIYATNVAMGDQAVRKNTPCPVASAALSGCLESGKDATEGGCEHNSYGLIGVGIGNLADSLQIIDTLVFQEKRCSAKELLDALLNDYKGYEELHSYIVEKLPHFGNGDEYTDRYFKWIADCYSDISWPLHGPRGQFKAGLWSVTCHVGLGQITGATPDGRRAGAPLAESTAPVQGMDKSGPLSMLLSVSGYDQSRFGNGTSLNMKFHPSVVSSDDAKSKLRQLIETYFFDRGGMQLQFNIAGADKMMAAQEDPEAYRDLVVRIAGFSAYFIEMTKEAQDELITRTIHAL